MMSRSANRGWSAWCACWGLGLVLAFVLMSASAYAQAAPPNPLVPANDNDLTQAVALAKRMSATAAQCKTCKSGGGQLSCADAAAAAKAADDLRVNLYAMQAALKAAMNDMLQHLQQLQADSDQRDASATAARNIQTASKTALDIGKIMVDSMNLMDSVKNISAMLNSGPLPGNLTVVPDIHDPIYAGSVKNMDTLVETASGLVGAADDLDTLGSNKQSRLPAGLSDLMAMKGAATDLINATKNYEAYYKAAAAATSAADNAEALKSLAEARKGLLNVAFKIGIKLADNEQAKLTEELKEYKDVSNAADEVSQVVLADMTRLAHREQALQAALDAARDAGSGAYACAAQCSEAQPPAPIPDFGSESYGAALRARNIELTGLLSKNKTAPPNACKVKPKPAIAKKPAPSTPPASTKPKTDCANHSGLEGAINKETCQIQHQ